MRISDWSSDVCYSDLLGGGDFGRGSGGRGEAQTVAVERGQHGAQPRGVEHGGLQRLAGLRGDRTSDVLGKSVSVSVDLGGRRFIQKKNQRCQVQSSCPNSKNLMIKHLIPINHD